MCRAKSLIAKFRKSFTKQFNITLSYFSKHFAVFLEYISILCNKALLMY